MDIELAPLVIEDISPELAKVYQALRAAGKLTDQLDVDDLAKLVSVLDLMAKYADHELNTIRSRMAKGPDQDYVDSVDAGLACYCAIPKMVQW